MPNLPPHISTEVNINKKDIAKLLLMSIALEEISLSHILNTQGEIIQTFIKQLKCSNYFDPEELIKINRNVRDTLRILLEKEKTLKEKLLHVIEFDEENIDDCYNNYCNCFKQH